MKKTRRLDPTSHVPLYYQLTEIIKDLIKNGDLKPGDALWSEQELVWELLQTGQVKRLTLDADSAIALLKEAVEAAKNSGLPWREEPLALNPGRQLINAVVESQRLAVRQGGESDEGDD